jgi:hypothetical protein
METETRLARRAGLLERFEDFLREATFAKLHKDSFSLPKKILWKYDNESGQVDLKDATS